MKKPNHQKTPRRNARTLPIRRSLRRRSTKPERLMWSALRDRRFGKPSLKFRRQHSISPFVVDFACDEKRVIIEIDGNYHDDVGEQDKVRQKALEELGWTVIRYANEDVLKDLEAVLLDLAKRLGVQLQT